MPPLALFGTFGFQELLLILVLVVFLFGARKIPEVAKGLGEGIRNFRSSLKGEDPGHDGAPTQDEAHKTPDK